MRFRHVVAIGLLALAGATLTVSPLAAQQRGDDEPTSAESPDESPPVAGAAPVARAPLVALGASAAALRDSIVALARAQIGRRYRFGGETPEGGFDCSGLVQYVLAAFDVTLPRTAAQQARTGTAMVRDSAELRPGDLLTFGRGSRISHIAIYVGNGRMVHASSAAGRVIETRVDREPSRLIKPWRGVRRITLAPERAIAAEHARVRRAAILAARGVN